MTLLKLAFWGAVVVLLGIKSTDHVDEGQLALRRRGGKVVRYWFGPRKGEAKIYGPGIKFLIPFVHSYWKMSVQRRQIELRHQTCALNGHFVTVTPSIAFKVTDIETALVDNQDIDAVIMATCDEHIGRLIRDRVEPECIGERMLSDRVVTAELGKLGVQLIQLSIVYAGETDNSQLAWALREAGVGAMPALVSLQKGSNGHHPVEISSG